MTRLLASGCVIEVADSCTCPPHNLTSRTPLGPKCPVRQGRRARGPKPRRSGRAASATAPGAPAHDTGR